MVFFSFWFQELEHGHARLISIFYKSPPSKGKIKSEALRLDVNGSASPAAYLLCKSFMRGSMKMGYGKLLSFGTEPKIY
jgi:hypothetical protein